MPTAIQSIDTTTSNILVNGVEALRMQQGGVVYGNGGGQLAGFRNVFINGGCTVAQRGTVTLSTSSSVYGGCDRWITSVSATTVSALALQAVVNLPSSTGYGHQIGNVTTTGSTTIGLIQRIEAREAARLIGKTVTLSAKVYQSSGSTISMNWNIQRPTSTIDTFSSTTLITNTSGVSIPSATWTTVTGTYAVTQADAQWGIQFGLNATGLAAQSNSQWYFCDLQCEVGSVATPFEVRPHTIEQLLCQRYLPSYTATATTTEDIGYGLITAGTTAVVNFQFYVEPRVPPTSITVSNAGHFTFTTATVAAAVSSFTLLNAGKRTCRIQLVSATNTFTINHPCLWYSSNSAGVLYFNGCEL